MSSNVVIRPLASHADYAACVALQRAIWGEAFLELVPPAMLMITQKVGGIAAGAFLGDELVGFVYGVTGWKAGRPVHWSHMLGVAEAHRDRGIGRQLKEHQREALRAAGVRHMSWTFDPLVARNAHLNLKRLGARVTEYVADMYGDDPTSTMDSIIGSDRFVVEWDLKAGRREGGKVGTRAGRKAGAWDVAPRITPSAAALVDAPVVLVGVPADVQQLKLDAPDDARAWRTITRAAFQHYLPRGYGVRDVAVDGSTGTWYVLERAE